MANNEMPSVPILVRQPSVPILVRQRSPVN